MEGNIEKGKLILVPQFPCLINNPCLLKRNVYDFLLLKMHPVYRLIQRKKHSQEKGHYKKVCQYFPKK